MFRRHPGRQIGAGEHLSDILGPRLHLAGLLQVFPVPQKRPPAFLYPVSNKKPLPPGKIEGSLYQC
jgi:hypothetical protein